SPSGMPQPRNVSGYVACDALRLIACAMRAGGQLGRACMRHAASPATSGVENDVPLSRLYRFGTCVVGSAMRTATPWATRSGFVRPSYVGPREEKVASTPSESTAPTASTLSPFASEGAE